MFCFAGWNFFGAGSALLMTQGVNILINIFFGVTLNAARGIANQVDSTVQQFVNNFTTEGKLDPEIYEVGSYAIEDFYQDYIGQGGELDPSGNGIVGSSD